MKKDVPFIVSLSTQLPRDVAADAEFLCDKDALLRDAINITPYLGIHIMSFD
jgi:hypothetical protein